MGMAGLGFTKNLPGAWWMLSGTIGLLVLATFFAEKARTTGCSTLPELVGSFYGKDVRTAASLLIVLSWVGVIAVQIVASGKVLSAVFGGSETLIMIACTAVFVLYTAQGGQKSVVRTDLMQFVIIILGLGLLFSRGLEATGSSVIAGLSFPTSAEMGTVDVISMLLVVGSENSSNSKRLVEVGEQFAGAGIIDQPDDLCFLYISELDTLSKREPRAWRALIASRRLDFDREARRRQVPRVLVSDGRAIYEGFGSETEAADVITGSPVSPGVVEGVVHVVFDPQEARLIPGEILVCAGTDPAWTPLFMAARGLVTEVGGMMTHGSVVAREYGIPAVVGVHEATRRLKDGQKIRLDGSAGKITLMG